MSLAILESLGSIELIVILLVIAIPLWAIISAVTIPESVWRAAGRSKTGWVVALVVTLPIGFGLIVALIYLIGVRPSLKGTGA